MQRTCVALYITLVILGCAVSFHGEVRTRHNKYYGLMMLNTDDDSGKFKIITPDKIASLFGSSPSTTNQSPTSSSSKTVYESYKLSEDDDDEKEAEVPKSQGKMTLRSIDNEFDEDDSEYYAPPTSGKKTDKEFFRDLNKLESIIRNSGTSPKPIDYRPKKMSVARIDDDMVDVDYEQQDSLGLNKALDKKSLADVKDVISMSDSSPASNTPPRSFSYEPREVNFNTDRMLYGAYRNAKKLDMEPSKIERKGKQVKSRRKGRAGVNMDSFYNSIRNLGSSGSTALLDPPSKKRPVQTSKAPLEKAKKTIITPDDINSLFKKPQESAEAEIEEEMEEEMEEVSFAMPSAQMAGGETESVNMEPIPQWLLDADKGIKDRKKSLKMKKKKKKITDDWRFWAAMITGAGFVTAFVNIYQQTGGFGTSNGVAELII